jgi:hypothetical protein
MSPQEDRLKQLFLEQQERLPVPEFEKVWRRSVARAGRGERATVWQWFVGPTLAAISAAVVAVAMFGVNIDQRAPKGESLASRQVFTAMTDAGTVSAPSESNNAVVATESASDSNALYVGGTDFLLNMDIPAWK